MSTNGLLFIVDPTIYDVEVKKVNVVNGDLLRPVRFIKKDFVDSIHLLLKSMYIEKPEKIIFDKIGIGLRFYELFMKIMKSEEYMYGISVDAFGTVSYKEDKTKEEKVMKKGLTEIVFILDKSGSMNSIKDDAIGGFNSFVEEQMKNEGETRVNLVLFDSEVKLHNDITKLDDKIYQPYGMTALLDAIGVGIENMNKKLYNTPESERPENIIFTIMTDGAENSSVEYNKSAIEQMIKEKTAQDWQFIFLGANIDSVSTAKGLGINGMFAGDFSASGNGGSMAMLHASEMVKTYRDTGKMRAFDINININNEENDKKTASEIVKEISKNIQKLDIIQK